MPEPTPCAACGTTVPDPLDLHWSSELEDEVCPDCCTVCEDDR